MDLIKLLTSYLGSLVIRKGSLALLNLGLHSMYADLKTKKFKFYYKVPL